MALSASQTDETNHHIEALRALRHIASCENGIDLAEFCFEVPLHRCSLMTSASQLVGDLSLAIYNDLKLSQYLLEEDHSSTRDQRHFRLTSLGRSVAARAQD
ncbi:MAG: hypothetical protein WBW04_16420 [Nitrolancea sp.]